MTRISSNRMDLERGRVDNAYLRDYGETLDTEYTGSAYTVNLSTANVFKLALNANCTFTFSNPPASGTHGAFTLILQQDTTGGRTVTWPASVAWPGGTAPTLSSAAKTADVLNFATYNGGTSWFGFLAAQGVSISTYPPYWIPFGYFGGGNPSTSRIDRIDYSNDTATAVAKGPLSSARYNSGATGNSSFAYFGGFGQYGHPIGSTVDRVDFSNDTATSLVKGPLSSARYSPGATGNTLFGYFAGGGAGSPTFQVSRVDRIDYSNDTATAAVKGPISSARYSTGTTGTSAFAYIAGGAAPTSLVDRIDYSNDAATAAVKGPLGAARYGPAATGNSAFGYIAGGTPTLVAGPATSTIYRIDYSNDTATAAAKGPLSRALKLLAASGNSSFGYFGGGYGLLSIVDRVDYSNDTATAAVKGPLSSARYSLAGTNHAAGT